MAEKMHENPSGTELIGSVFIFAALIVNSVSADTWRRVLQRGNQAVSRPR
jgi:hypothetical protein